MVKKLICLLSVFTIGVSQNAFAAPSVKKLGNNSLNSVNVKPVINVPVNNKVNTGAIVAKSAKTPVAKLTALTTQEQRIPTITKTITNVKPVPTVMPGSGVSEDAFNSAVDRIEALESQTANVITDVVTSENGNYVTDVAVEGNKLNVNKTRLLYAPVRNGNSEEISGDAEIWIVR